MNIYYIIGAVAIILILLFVYWYSHRSNKEPHEYILVVSFDDGYYYDLCEDERFKKLAQFEKNNNILRDLGSNSFTIYILSYDKYFFYQSSFKNKLPF